MKDVVNRLRIKYSIINYKWYFYDKIADFANDMVYNCPTLLGWTLMKINYQIQI